MNLSDIKLEEGLRGKERLRAFLVQIKDALFSFEAKNYVNFYFLIC